jgi:small multidrug resistance pump
MKPLLILLAAIASEVAATASLKASEGFTRLVPSVVVVVGYGLAFYLLSLTLKLMPVGYAYAIWSGLGTVGAAALGAILFRETFDLPRILGMVLIIAGVVVMNVFSRATAG